MPNNRVVFVMGDMEPAANRMPQQLLPYLENLGYTVLVASSYPENRLAEIYGDSMPHVVSIDHLLPFSPKEHGYQQLHRRIALAVRLGGMAQAFKMFPDAQLAVCGDSDVLMLTEAEVLRERLLTWEAYTTRLPFDREEAPYGWVNDLGLAMSRQGLARLAETLPEQAATWMPETAPHVSVHGLLGFALWLAPFAVRLPLLGGYYPFPGDRQRFVFNALMPEDSWLNSGAVATTVDSGRPLFAHACMKTMPDLGLPTDEVFGWWLAHLAGEAEKDPYYRPFEMRWRETTEAIRARLKAAGKRSEPAAYWQNWRTMQLVADGKDLPPPRADGPVTAVTAETIRTALCP